MEVGGTTVSVALAGGGDVMAIGLNALMSISVIVWTPFRVSESGVQRGWLIGTYPLSFLSFLSFLLKLSPRG